MTILTKTIDRLSLEEINLLISVSRTTGFMKALMSNLKNQKVKNPELIRVYMNIDIINLAGWLLIDEANEFSENLINQEVSMMLYTSHKYRNQGIMNELIKKAKPKIKDKILKVYADPWEKEWFYIKRLADKHELTIQSHISDYGVK